MSSLGRWMFAVAVIAFGIQQFLYGDFVAGRAPVWPPDLPGRLPWAYASGLLLIASAAAIGLGRRAQQAAWCIAAIVLAWAVVRNVPLALADHSFGSAWTRLGKGIALSGGALAAAGTISSRVASPRSVQAWRLVGQLTLGSFLIASGVQHFLFPNAVKTLVPVWIPGALLWAYFAGAALIAGGIGLILPRTTRLAGIAVGLMLITWLCILHVPRALAASPANQRNEWTAVFEALAFAGIALVLIEDD
jgi:uncharacterized membrane protein